MDEWVTRIIAETVRRLEKGEKLQLEYDKNGKLKLLEIKTTVVMRND
jgi:hypothetical protein